MFNINNGSNENNRLQNQFTAYLKEAVHFRRVRYLADRSRVAGNELSLAESEFAIVRSATSIGANANEAIYGISKADFIAKLQISLKETAETEYWLRLLILAEYITEKDGESLLNDCLEIKRILISSLNTAKENK